VEPRPLWTIWIIVIDRRLVRRSPYRLMLHPAYAIAAAELTARPMALRLPLMDAV
jgi:isoprenylcysteine carboxyl methyltransferase (ICMT) family protein YpbQ